MNEERDDLPHDEELVVHFDLRTAPVPKEIEKAWQKLNQSAVSKRNRRVIYRAVVLNQGWRKAAEAEKAPHFRAAFTAAKSYGLAARTQKQTLADTNRILSLANEELERRLLQNPEEPSFRDLTTLAAKNTERLQSAWQEKQRESRYPSVLDKLAQLFESGGSAKLELTVTPQDSAVDVTPSESKSPY